MVVDLQLVKTRSDELVGEALDWAVAIAKNGKVLIYPDGGMYPPAGSISLNEDNFSLWLNLGDREEDVWCPSSDWQQAWPLIVAALDGEQLTINANSLVNALKAVVIKVLGEFVDVPAQILDNSTPH